MNLYQRYKHSIFYKMLLNHCLKKTLVMLHQSSELSIASCEDNSERLNDILNKCHNCYFQLWQNVYNDIIDYLEPMYEEPENLARCIIADIYQKYRSKIDSRSFLDNLFDLNNGLINRILEDSYQDAIVEKNKYINPVIYYDPKSTITNLLIKKQFENLILKFPGYVNSLSIILNKEKGRYCKRFKQHYIDVIDS